MTKILILVPVLLLFYSCSYSTIKDKEKGKTEVIIPQKFIPELSNKLPEISGLIIYDDLFWGFNDSGGKNKIYGFSKKGNIKKEVELSDAKNQDWESITQDRKHIYIGDFGNNNGTRKNLRIYKIKKKDLKNKKEQKVDTKEIKFKYALQKNFNGSWKTEFDCEAMVEFKGSLYLFSKSRKDFTTTVYKVPTKKGTYNLDALDTFNVDGLITGADISPDKNQLALVGYKNYQSFIWLFSDFKNNDFFKGKNKRLHIQGSQNLQSEGICYYNNDTLLVSCEKTSNFNQQVFLFDISILNNGTH